MDEDPWSKGGELARQDVREIFARHASTPESRDEKRRATLPNFLTLPLHGWRLLGFRGRVIASAIAAAIVVALIILIPPAFDNGQENVVRDREARAADRERLRQELVEEQRPHTAKIPAGTSFAVGLAGLVGQDAQRRVKAGELDGPIRGTTCESISRTGQDPNLASFTCLAETGKGEGVYMGRPLVSGYRFRGQVKRDSAVATWCKEEPRPLHPDQEEFIEVPLARACTG